MAQIASVTDVRSPRTLGKDTVKRTFQRDREQKVQETKPSEKKEVVAKDATAEVLARRWPALSVYDQRDPSSYDDAKLRAYGMFPERPQPKSATSVGSARDGNT